MMALDFRPPVSDCFLSSMRFGDTPRASRATRLQINLLIGQVRVFVAHRWPFMIWRLRSLLSPGRVEERAAALDRIESDGKGYFVVSVQFTPWTI